jgi:hypothetical protein
MKAFVRVKNGHFSGVDYFAAWHGFDELGYEVLRFDDEDVGRLDVTAQTPVVAGLGTARGLIKKFFGWDYNGVDPYPVELKDFFMREVSRTKWRHVKTAVMSGKSSKFIKPVIEKQFTGGVASSVKHSIRKSKIRDDNEVYICDPVTFGAEFRVYVHDDEIVGIKHYNGSWYMHPSQESVEYMIRQYKPAAPVAYGLDVGILSVDGQLRTALVEVNDGICLGNYGLDSKHYAQMIAARWQELIEDGRAQESNKGGCLCTCPDQRNVKGRP